MTQQDLDNFVVYHGKQMPSGNYWLKTSGDDDTIEVYLVDGTKIDRLDYEAELLVSFKPSVEELVYLKLRCGFNICHH